MGEVGGIMGLHHLVPKTFVKIMQVAALFRTIIGRNNSETRYTIQMLKSDRSAQVQNPTTTVQPANWR